MPGDKRRREVQKRKCIKTKLVYSKKLRKKVHRCVRWKLVPVGK